MQRMIQVDKRQLLPYAQPPVRLVYEWMMNVSIFIFYGVALLGFMGIIILFIVCLSMAISEGLTIELSLLLVALAMCGWIVYIAGSTTDDLKSYRKEQFEEVLHGVIQRRGLDSDGYYLLIQGYNRQNKIRAFKYRFEDIDWIDDPAYQKGEYADFRSEKDKIKALRQSMRS